MSFKADNGATIAASGTTGADGKETTLVILTLRDASDNPVTGKTVAFESTLSGLKFGTMTDQGDGTYTATLSGRTVGSVNSLRRNSCTSLVIALFLICAGLTGAVMTIFWTLIQGGMQLF